MLSSYGIDVGELRRMWPKNFRGIACPHHLKSDSLIRNDVARVAVRKPLALNDYEQVQPVSCPGCDLLAGFEVITYGGFGVFTEGIRLVLRTLHLSRLQPLQLEPVGVNVRKVVLRLLNKPAFGAAAENLGQAHGHFRRYAALFVHQFG